MRTLRTSALPLVLALIGIGAAVRGYHLDGKGLWTDELYSANLVLHRDATGFDQISRFRRANWLEIEDSDTFWTVKAAGRLPPLFELLAKLSTRWLGPTEFALRMPSLIASVLLLGFLGWLALTAREPPESDLYLLLLALFTFSAAAIEFAQEARSYSLGLLFSTLLCVRLFRRLGAGPSQSDLPAWPEIVIFVLACHTHTLLLAFSGLLIVLYFFLAFRRRDWAAACRLSIVPLSCIPWLALSAHGARLAAQGDAGWRRKAGLGTAVWDALRAHDKQLGKHFLLIALALALAFLATRTLAAARSRGFRGNLDLIVLLSIVIAQILIVSKIAAMTRMFQPRHVLFGLPAVMLLVAATAVKLIPWRSVLVGVGALLAATQLPLVQSYFERPKEGYREATRWVLEGIDAQGIVVTAGRADRDYYRFYLEQGDERLPSVSLASVDEAPPLCERLAAATTVGVLGHRRHRSLVDALVASCGARFVRNHQEFHRIFAQRWTADTSAPGAPSGP